MTLAELTPEWAQKVLTATTRSHEQGRRQTYIYLHDLLYPLYAQLPAFLDDEQRHQFLVFADDNTLNKLVRWMNALAEKAGVLEGYGRRCPGQWQERTVAQDAGTRRTSGWPRLG